MHGKQHSFSINERVFLRKFRSFWDQKSFDLRGTRTYYLWIHAECSIMKCKHVMRQQPNKRGRACTTIMDTQNSCILIGLPRANQWINTKYFNLWATKLHHSCIKPPTLHVNSSNGWKPARKYKVGLLKRSQGRNKRLFFDSWYCNTFWSDKADGSRRMHPWLPYRNDQQRRSQRPRRSYHNLISSFSEWLLSALTNIATHIDINITAGIGAVIAINISTLIKILDKVCGCN